MKSKKFLIIDLKKLFKDQLKINIKSTGKIYDCKEWDSIANFNLLLAIEKKFKIKLSSQEFNNLNSYKEILKVVTKKFK